MVHRKLDRPDLPRTGLFEILLLLLGRRKLARVDGSSMQPTLKHGDWVLYRNDTYPADLVDRVVVCKHPYEKRLIIKRVQDVAESGGLYLIGDFPEESTDSRTFGTVSRDRLVGYAVSYRRPTSIERSAH